MISGLYNGENMMKRLSLVLIIVVMLMSAFTASNGLAAEQADEIRAAANPNAEFGTDFALADLDGTEWVLTSLNDNKPIPGTRITLTFSEGITTGFAGCNWYGTMITEQLCGEPEGIMEQEEEYIEALREAVTYRTIDNRLEIDNAEGKTILTFTAIEELPMNPEDLVGTQWQLITMDGNVPAESSTITIAFSEDGGIEGDAGCRNYYGSYEASGDDIRFPSYGMKGISCQTSALSIQEGKYTDHLTTATNYRLVEEELEISTASGGVLIFALMHEKKPIDPLLNGTEWVLTSLDGNTLLKNTRITLSFLDGSAGGIAGCNNYGGRYTIADEGILTIPEIWNTEVGCMKPKGILQQEERYLGILYNVKSYTFEEDRLTLMAEDGRTLVYKSGLDANAESVEKLPGFGIFGVVISVLILFLSRRMR